MGSNCSCLHGGGIDEKQVCTENGIQIDRKLLRSLGSPSKDNNVESTNLSRNMRFELSEILAIQSLLRGYLERKKVKHILHTSQKNTNAVDSFKEKSIFAGMSRNSPNFKEFSRPELQELSPENIPEYPNNAIKQILIKLGPFVFRDNQSANFNKKGPVLMENQAIYIGEWNQNNLRNGKGVQKWPDGSMYEGYWENDKANGKGRLIHANGDVYEGDWKDDKAHGHGLYIHNDGAKYEGQWINDKQHGNGTEVWPDGAKYQGKYENGLKHGRGKFEWADNSTYEGDFCENNIHGKGIYIWSDGRKYVGDWRDNKMHGKGLFTWRDGRSFQGDYVEDKKHGYGVFIWSDGRKYEGQWKDGKQHGKGVFTSQNGEVKESEWQDGKRSRGMSFNQDT